MDYIITIPAIVAVCELLKKYELKKSYIPVCAVLIGGLFSLIYYYVNNDFYTVKNMIEALFFGFFSGLSSCGLYDSAKLVGGKNGSGSNTGSD